MLPSRVFVLLLVVALASGCAPKGSTSPSPSPTNSASSASATLPPSPSSNALPSHQVIGGTSVAGTFDAATDGNVIAWSNGAIDQNAPELWQFDPVTGASRTIFKSTNANAILANLAVRNGRYAFAEVDPKGSARTWSLVVLDASGAPHVVDNNDLPPSAQGQLPMTALSDTGLLWATGHAGTGSAPECTLRFAALADLQARTIEGRPCSQKEFWYPATDGVNYVYGTVEYPAGGGPDDRHVYLTSEGDFVHPKQLDTDGEASWPVILGETVVWKTAPREFNVLNRGNLVEYAPTTGKPATLGYLVSREGTLTAPSIGPGYIAAEGNDPLSVVIWDRVKAQSVVMDRLPNDDPGFFSGVRLSGNLLIWFYTNSTLGGGEREIRWIDLSTLSR